MEDNYKLSELIEEGCFSEVYRATKTSTNEIVVVKQIKFDESDGVPYKAVRELSILKELCHENIVRLVESFFLKDCVWLVFEHLNTDLYNYIKSTTGEIDRDLVKDLALKFSNLDPAGLDLLKRMLCLNPEEWISAKSALKHGYFNPRVNV